MAALLSPDLPRVHRPDIIPWLQLLRKKRRQLDPMAASPTTTKPQIKNNRVVIHAIDPATKFVKIDGGLSVVPLRAGDGASSPAREEHHPES
eukprot:CAMPEP_0175961994 /NCGR_PEP_ID=MMETSP0108-20121206/36235_1 /TAXON_ID=195067 ORGANISM="Goniomonas pacifica, Strain CCMP1869" /NCGR_SAMPLE_ID=MMETSP0108 /ASSEMBLY_ACC=CAM_ASM_000204 /LENGTH=91 /DNA_ID=CAMNT_0017289767 /DNA_START=68 /DNA_END=343 /DNA_ORIENTATION=-